MVTIELELYSPRWGRNDRYEVELHHDYMKITHLTNRKSCQATWVMDCDPEWSGERFDLLLLNDHIRHPTIAQDMLQTAWLCWKNGELTHDQVVEEVKLVGDWINATTRSKPDSEFWNNYF